LEKRLLGNDWFVRAVGGLLVAAGVAFAAVGLLWLFLALYGREWDYCPSGKCYAGELMGTILLVLGSAAAFVGVRIFRSR